MACTYSSKIKRQIRVWYSFVICRLQEKLRSIGYIEVSGEREEGMRGKEGRKYNSNGREDSTRR